MPTREGSLEAPERQPIDWRSPDFRDRASLEAEMERVFDICHGCRRCVNLCQAFPTLFDLIDESDTLEVDGVDKADYGKVADHCYLCDLCAETKCPYLPPHEWAVDFPHLMLRAKAQRFGDPDTRTRWRDRLITSTGPLFEAAALPGVAALANAAAASKPLRRLGERLGIHPEAPLPRLQGRKLARRVPAEVGAGLEPRPSATTTGKVAVFTTCYGHHEPAAVEDLVAVLNHNGVPVRVLHDAQCCGMPKFELGDLDAVADLKARNLPLLLAAVDDGYDLMSIIPSCTLMYRQELPLMFPEEAAVARVAERFFDPFEYLVLRSREQLVRTDFRTPLGKVAYHAACHQRVQNAGARTREFLAAIPGTEVAFIERCSGHDGTYAVKSETFEAARKIARPVVNRVRGAEPDLYGSDCPLAGRMIAFGLDDGSAAVHPISMVRTAYGI